MPDTVSKGFQLFAEYIIAFISGIVGALLLFYKVLKKIDKTCDLATLSHEKIVKHLDEHQRKEYIHKEWSEQIQASCQKYQGSEFANIKGLMDKMESNINTQVENLHADVREIRNDHKN